MKRGRKGVWRAEYIVLRERRERSLQSDIRNFFLDILLKFAWLLGRRVGEKGGEGAIIALRSPPRDWWLPRRSKERGGLEKKVILSREVVAGVHESQTERGPVAGDGDLK